MRGKILLIVTASIIVPGCNNNSWHKVSQKEANKIASKICEKWRLSNNLTIKYKNDQYYIDGKWVDAISDILEYSIDEGYLKFYYEVAQAEPANKIKKTVDYTLVEKEKDQYGSVKTWYLHGSGDKDYHEVKTSDCFSTDYIESLMQLRDACLAIVVDYELYQLAILPECTSTFGEDFESIAYSAKGNDSLKISAKTTKNTEGNYIEYHYHYENGFLVDSTNTYFNENDTKLAEYNLIYDHKNTVHRAEEVKSPEEWDNTEAII